MRLELVHPPRLVTVADAGSRRPALLLATRDGRHYVQVSHGPGLNCLRWVPAEALGPAGTPADAVPAGVINAVLPHLFGAREVRDTGVDHVAR